MKKKWSESEIDKLRSLYAEHGADQIATILGRSVSSIHNKSYLLGLKKSKEWIAENSRKSAAITGNGKKFGFKKGNPTWNKGMIGLDIGGKETRFKKGSIPQTHKPVGTERITKDGYIEVKVAERDQWKGKQYIVWEQTYGPVPKGKFLRFRDGNNRNFLLLNLEIVDRVEHMKRNTVHRYPRELKYVMRLNKRLKREINHEERH